MNKQKFVIPGMIVCAILFVIAFIASVNNKAISLEEQINNSSAQINVAEKRRADLIVNLVDTVIDYRDYEQETLIKITEARTESQKGNLDNAMTVLNAVAEEYPDLKANENYKELMHELSLTENSIAQYRNNYNIQVKSYNKFVRSFPNNIVLNILGYDQIEAEYTNFEVSEDAPTNLFGK